MKIPNQKPDSADTQSLDFKTLFLGVRPARVAILVNVREPDWQEMCLRIVEHFSSVWGGEYHIVVPTDGTSLSARFWNLLEAFDPDYVFYYQKSGKDLKLANEQEFNEEIERVVRKFIEENPDATEAHTRSRIVEIYEERKVDDFAISPSLEKDLKTWLAPLHFKDRVLEAELRADAVPRSPLTAIHKVIPFSERAKQIHLAGVSIPSVPELWLNCVTGRYTASYLRKMEELKFRITQEVFEAGQESELFRLYVNQQSPTLSPFSISSTEMAYYTSAGKRDWDESAIVVVGNSLKDFCLYQGLSRLRYCVSWLIPDWLDAFVAGKERAKVSGTNLGGSEMLAFHFAHALLTSTRSGGTDKQIIFMSETLSLAELGKAMEVLDESLLMGDRLIAGRSTIKESFGDLLECPKVLYEREQAGRPKSYQFIDRSIAGFLETPKPIHLKTVVPGEHRWIAEFTVQGQVYPRHPALGEFMVKVTAGPKGARSGRNGIAYDCPNWMTYGTDIDAILVKPVIFLPDAFEMAEHIALQKNLHCKYSDKGHFLAETIRKFGELAILGQFLKDPQKRNLLDKYLDRGPSGREEGVFLTSDNRRYLDFKSIENIFGSRQKVKEVLDFLIPRFILQRGLILKCQFCRGADWFSMEEVTDEYRCKRCGKRQVISSQHWREPEEPAWYYKLDEIVYLTHLNNLGVSALALDFMEHHKAESFMYTTDLEFSETSEGSPYMEIDLFYIQDGHLCIGEAKKEDCLGQNAAEDNRVAERYLKLAEKLGIGNVLFATAAVKWSDRTTAEIKRVFFDSRIRYQLLHQSDLLK